MNRLCTFLMLYACLPMSISRSQIPRILTYQGSLTTLSGQNPADGAYAMIFRLYDANTGGTVLWQEERTVELIDGSFIVTLGEMAPLTLSFSAPYWLGMTVLPEKEIVPRTALTAAGYSISSCAVQGTSNVFPSSGNVGIGTTVPEEKVQVAGIVHSLQGGFKFPDGTLQTTAAVMSLPYEGTAAKRDYLFSIKNTDTAGHGVRFEVVSTTGTALYAKGGINGLAADFQGKVVLRSCDTAEPIMELGEGLDFAEGFAVSENVNVAAGSVMIINPDDPGKLTVSDKPYDKRVAGILAGANGLGSGVRLGGERYHHALAIAGRVYCNVEASRNGVEPGDLLTTSSIPGYAMKAGHSRRAAGAIVGKAMQKLKKGQKGQILVLISLQ